MSAWTPRLCLVLSKISTGSLSFPLLSMESAGNHLKERVLNVCDQTKAFQVNWALATQSRLRAMGIALLHLVKERHISSTNSPASHCQESLQAKEGKEREAQKKPCTCLRPTLWQYLVPVILICPWLIRKDSAYVLIFFLSLGSRSLCLENKGTRCLQRDPASSRTAQNSASKWFHRSQQVILDQL